MPIKVIKGVRLLVKSPAIDSVDFHTSPVCNISLNGTITRNAVDQIERRLREAIAKGTQHVLINLDSPGGCVYSTLRLASLIKSVRRSGTPVDTCVTGRAFSAAAVVFACGENRFMAKEATVMIHSVTGSCRGSLSDINTDKCEIRRLQLKLNRLMVSGSKKKLRYYKKICSKNKDVYMDARSAKQIGLATVVGLPTAQCHIDVRCTVQVAGT